MSKFPARISTKDLKISDVPDVSASLHEINRFALTFDPAERNPYVPAGLGFKGLTADSDLTELRGQLFVEQRRWNHYCRMPDPETESEFRSVVERIRGKLLHGDEK